MRHVIIATCTSPPASRRAPNACPHLRRRHRDDIDATIANGHQTRAERLFFPPAMTNTPWRRQRHDRKRPPPPSVVP